MDVDSQLRSACVDGDVSLVNEILASKPPLETQCSRGYTPLHLAAYYCHAEIVSALLADGANPNAIDLYGNGPLWSAVMQFSGDVAVVQSLLASGADPFQSNRAGRTPASVVRHAELEPLFAGLTPSEDRANQAAFGNPNCPDCDAEPGALHDPFCLRERCPFCSQQLPTCDCIFDVLKLNAAERTAVEEYVDDSVEPLRSILERWSVALEKKGRIPW